MATDGLRPAGTYWWQSLRRPTGEPPPPSVVERLAWYEKQVRRNRIGFYVLEAVVILTSAAIPAAAAAGAPVVAAGILGAVVTALVGLRQLVRLNESWIRFGGVRMAVQRELIAWSLATPPYAEANADARLAMRVEELVGDETAQWTEQRSAPGEPQQTALPDPRQA
jgi:hypothetical protein